MVDYKYPPLKKGKKPKSGCRKLLELAAVVFLFGAVFVVIVTVRSETPPLQPRPTPTPTATWAELRAAAQTIPYRNLFRYADDHAGKLVYYRGEVIQVLEKQGDFQLRVNVTSDEYGLWSDTVFLRYDDAPVRILENDIIEFVGRMEGTITYESVMGGDVIIPDITVLVLIIESE